MFFITWIDAILLNGTQINFEPLNGVPDACEEYSTTGRRRSVTCSLHALNTRSKNRDKTRFRLEKEGKLRKRRGRRKFITLTVDTEVQRSKTFGK